MIPARNYCPSYFTIDGVLVENRLETDYHFCIPLQSCLSDHHSVCRGNRTSSKSQRASAFRWLITWSMRVSNRFILNCSSMISATARAVCLCRPDVHGFVTVISFSVAMNRINDGKIHYSFNEYQTLYRPKV